ncbi:MAG: signal peptidase I [Aerococcus sp.]|nr:signal peptidase I [Aerococcus sp.]
MRRIGDFFLSFVLPMVITLVVMWAIYSFIGAPVKISGSSMAPTLTNGEHVWMNHLDKTYDRGEIVIFDAPDGSGDEYVKRVIGVPGDTVSYLDNQLYINGEPVEEDYLNVLKSKNPNEKVTPDFSLETLPSTQQEKVPAGKLFVLGDNRPVSKDSEEFGFIDQSHVKGTVSYRIWPVNKIGKVEAVPVINE